MEKKVAEIVEDLKKEIGVVAMDINTLDKEDGVGSVESAMKDIRMILFRLFELSEDYAKGIITADTIIRIPSDLVDSIPKYEIIKGVEK